MGATWQDIEDAADELQLKRGHRQALLNAFSACQALQ
jgi:hypothetical protein